MGSAGFNDMRKHDGDSWDNIKTNVVHGAAIDIAPYFSRLLYANGGWPIRSADLAVPNHYPFVYLHWGIPNVGWQYALGTMGGGARYSQSSNPIIWSRPFLTDRPGPIYLLDKETAWLSYYKKPTGGDQITKINYYNPYYPEKKWAEDGSFNATYYGVGLERIEDRLYSTIGVAYWGDQLQLSSMGARADYMSYKARLPFYCEHRGQRLTYVFYEPTSSAPGGVGQIHFINALGGWDSVVVEGVQRTATIKRNPPTRADDHEYNRLYTPYMAWREVYVSDTIKEKIKGRVYAPSQAEKDWLGALATTPLAYFTPVRGADIPIRITHTQQVIGDYEKQSNYVQFEGELGQTTHAINRIVDGTKI